MLVRHMDGISCKAPDVRNPRMSGLVRRLSAARDVTMLLELVNIGIFVGFAVSAFEGRCGTVFGFVGSAVGLLMAIVCMRVSIDADMDIDMVSTA